MTKIVLPFLRTPHNYDRDSVSNETGLLCEDATRTQQHFREECDINTIMYRFGKTGQLPSNIRTPSFADYTGVQDFHSAMNAVRAASEEFMQLPASIRARFRNNPQEYLEFFADDSNRAEAIQLGLIPPEAPVPEPIRVVIDPPVKADAPSPT